MATEQTNVRLDKELKLWLKDLATQQERSQTWIVNHLLKEAMQREQRPQPQ